MASYDMTKRPRLLAKASTSSSAGVRGKKRPPVSIPQPPPVQEDSLLLDGEIGFLLQENENKLLLDK